MKSPRSLITACFLFFLFAFNTAAQTNKITGGGPGACGLVVRSSEG